MADRITPAQRSANMARIRGFDTAPELLVRSYLHRVGIRFRLHASSLPGRPDIAVPRARTVVFVHGCYWHRHNGCALATTPKSNAAFWLSKLEGNVERDRRMQKQLRALGWNVQVIWECNVAKEGRLEALALEILSRME